MLDLPMHNRVSQAEMCLFYNLLFDSRQQTIDEKVLESRIRLPRLDSLRWRVDVGISTRYRSANIICSLFSCSLASGVWARRKLFSFDV